MAQESILRIIIDSRNAERNARNIANELQNIERNGDHASRSMDSMSVATRSLVGYMGGLVTIGAAISKMDTYTGLNNKLKLVTNSQVELNQALGDTFKIAQNTAQAWDSVAQIYQRFSDNSKRLNITQAQTAALTDTVAKSIAISGGSAASAEAALIQFSQALASNVLRGEELNSVMEQAPGLAKAIAQGMGITVGQLRSVAAEGKITGDVLVDALTKAKSSVDDLFSKTDFTISQSFTQLSNEVTKFVGEAGKGSGAASALGDSIGFLAKNLSTIADIAIVGGVAMLTKAILTQTVATYGSITASVARRSTLLAELAAQAAASTAEVARTGAIAQFTAMQLVDAKATAARMTGIQRLAYVQATVIPLEAKATQMTAAHTTATAADTVVQNANNAARSRGAMLLRMIGGPIGLITLGVAGLAAGYMYLKNRTAEANAKLEEQGKIAQETDAELRKLSGNDKISAVRDLTAAFNAQNETLAKSKESVDAVLFSIRAVSVENEAARKVTEDARNGVISYDEAIKRLNQMDIPTDLYDQLKKQVFQYNENAEKAGESQRALSALGKVVKLAGNLFQNAAVQVAKNTDELNKNETAAQKATKAQKGYFDSLNQDVLSANERLAYMNLGFSKEIIDQINKLQEAKQKALGDGVTAIVTTEEINKIVQAQKALDAVKNKEDEIAEAKRKQNKESEKKYQYTQAELKMLQKVAALSAKHDLDGIGAKYGIPKNYLAGLMAQESKGNPNAVSPTGAIGYFQTTSAYRKDNGLSVADSKNLPVIAEVVAKNLAKAYEELGDWEAAIRSHNAGLAGSAQFAKSGKVNGSAARNKEVANFAPAVNKWIVGLGGSALKNKGAADAIDDLKQYSEFLKEQAELRKNLEFNIASEVKQIRSKLADDLQEIDKAGFSPEETKRLTAEYQARADNDIAIAEYALKTKLDDYESFRKTESQLLEDSFNERKFYASRDLELTKEQRDKAVALLDEQLKQEQALIKLAYETRLFQLRENLMSETAATQERYRLERDQIRQNSKLSQEQKLREIALSKALQEEENRKRLNSAVQQWGGIQAEMNGTGDQYGLEQQRFSRYDASQQVFDTQIGQVEQAAQDPNANMEELAAQREAIWQAHHDRMTAIESDYQASSYSLQLGYGQQVTGALSGMFGAMLGESSSAYRALYTAQQSFALAQAGMNVWKAASDAYANEPGTVWQKMGAAALATIESGTFVTMIQAATPKGFASGGYTGHGGKYDPAGIVHKGEGVLTQEEVKALGGPQGFEDLRKSIRRGYATGGLVADTHRVGMGAVSAINSGGATVVQPKVVINNYSSEKVETSTNQDGELMVTIGKMLDQKIDTGVDRGIQRNLRQGYPLANAIKGR